MADQYFPDTFDLSSGTVQKIETSPSDPSVVYDSGGFRATDINGALLFSLDAVAGSASFAGHVAAAGLDLVFGAGEPAGTSNILDWLRASNGSQGARLETLTHQSIGQYTEEIARYAKTDNANAYQAYLELKRRTGIAANPSFSSISAVVNAITKILLNDSGQSDYVQTDATRKLSVSQQFNIPLNIPAGSNQNVVKNVGAIVAGEFVIVGHFDQRGGAWLDHAGWSMTALASPNVTFSFFNSGAGAGVGTFYFYVIHV